VVDWCTNIPLAAHLHAQSWFIIPKQRLNVILIASDAFHHANRLCAPTKGLTYPRPYWRLVEGLFRDWRSDRCSPKAMRRSFLRTFGQTSQNKRNVSHPLATF